MLSGRLSGSAPGNTVTFLQIGQVTPLSLLIAYEMKNMVIIIIINGLKQLNRLP